MTFSAPGYNNATVTITVTPTGFVFLGNSDNFSTTTFSSPTTVTVGCVTLNSGTLTTLNGSGGCYLNPGTGPFTLAVTSSNTSVGTITTSPVTINAGANQTGSTTFQPLTAGTSTISLGAQPAGFSATSSTNGTTYLSGTATVTAPNITVGSSTATTGVSLEVPLQFNLSQSISNPETITVTSSNPSVAVVSTSASTTGATTASFTGVSTTAQKTVYIQGLTQGTTTLTISAPGFNSATCTVTVDPSGFIVQTSSFTTTPSSPNTTISIYPAILTPGSLTYIAAAELNPSVGTVDVSITSSNTTVGTITSSPVVFTGGSSVQTTAFRPLTNGTTNLILGIAPTGFSTPSQDQQIAVTVN